MNKKHWLIDLSLIVIIIVMGVFVYLELTRTFTFIRQQAAPSAIQPAELLPEADLSQAGVLIDEPTPQAAIDLGLRNLDGDTIALADFKGMPVLINFWATWCPPCLDEMPLIQEYAERYEGELIVLAINAGEDESVVRAFIEENQLDLLFVLDPTSSATKQFRVYGFPTTLFLDAEGDVNSTHIGVLNTGLLDRHLLKIGIGE